MERSEKPTRKGRIENDEHDAGQRVGGGEGGNQLGVLGITIKLRETSLLTNFLFKLHYFKVSNHSWSLFLIGFEDYIKAQLHPIQFQQH